MNASRSALSLEARTPHAAAEFDLDALVDGLSTALWLYDFDACRIVWANRSALRLWDAASLDALRGRDLMREMSIGVRKRLAQHREDFELDPARRIEETWTLYPFGAPFRVTAILRRCDLDDGRAGMLVEANPDDGKTPSTVRSADALLRTPVLTALFDANGDELYANPSFRAAFGPGRRRCEDILRDHGDWAPFAEGLAAFGEHRATVRAATMAGLRWLDVHASGCNDAVTGDGAFLLSALDVTGARRQQQRLKEALDAAEAANEAKSRFLATMSHEMRTPLNGVLGMASVLEHGRLDRAQAQSVEMIRRSGIQLLEIVEDMLDIVALDSRAVELTPTSFSPSALVGAAIEGARRRAEAKALRLECDVASLHALRFTHDASRIRQVLGHLIDNAIKFTPNGVVMVAVEPLNGDFARGLLFKVCDDGVGVPPGEEQAIFERFHQVDGTITRRQGGTGLGLAICREMAALWGGEIGVTPREPQGSTFWFTVPALEATD